MRQDTIDKINARLELAQKRHGEFEHKAQVLDAIQLEIAEARYAFDWQDSDRFVAELLDVATVAIRGVEQLSGAETEAEAAEQEMPMMPDELWIPALTVPDPHNNFGTSFEAFAKQEEIRIGLKCEEEMMHWHYTVDQARLIRDWLNQFIAASEAEQ